jgi:Nodulation protein S (NodS)
MASMPRAYFEDIYRSAPDPWQFETSWYEQRKYALTLAALPERHYRSAFEPGCSIGVLSSLLANRCDQLLATDVVPDVVRRARRRCRQLPWVRIEHLAIPEEWPTGPFDLVVLSEIGYYFDRPTLDDIVSRLLATVTTSATLIAVHWRGATNYPLRGDEVHDHLDHRPELERMVHHVEPKFRLDTWIRRPDRRTAA